MGVHELLELLGPPIEDPEEESFLLFTSTIPSSNLGFLDSKTKRLEISINSRDLFIQQSPSLLNSSLPGGTTGAVVWKITPLVAEWFSNINNPLFSTGSLSSKSIVLELGTGISGLVVLALGPRVHRYIATDQTYVLKTLRNNIESNIVSDTSRQNKGSSNIDILELDWEQSNIDQLPALIPDLCKTQSHSGGLDVIVACDCIYNEALIPSFVDVCAELCSIGSKSLDENQSRDRSPPTICIVAQQLRSSIVLEAWLRYFHRRFQVWRIPDELLSEDLQEGKGFAVHIGIIR